MTQEEKTIVLTIVEGLIGRCRAESYNRYSEEIEIEMRNRSATGVDRCYAKHVQDMEYLGHLHAKVKEILL